MATQKVKPCDQVETVCRVCGRDLNCLWGVELHKKWHEEGKIDIHGYPVKIKLRSTDLS